MELKTALQKYTPSQIRYLAFISAHQNRNEDGSPKVVPISELPNWFRYSRWDFPETWEFIDRYTIILKNPPHNRFTKPHWYVSGAITTNATAAISIYFWLSHLIDVHGYGFLLAKQDICDTLGMSNTSVRKGIHLLRKQNLIDGYFPNGWPMQIIGVAPFSKQVLYEIRRELACRIQSPDGRVYGIPWGGQKKFAQRHGLNTNTLSKICTGRPISGWKLVTYQKKGKG